MTFFAFSQKVVCKLVYSKNQRERNAELPLRGDLFDHHGLIGDGSLIFDPSICEV